MKHSSEQKYLELLAERFPTIQDVCTEIINLKAILNLPKGTEHFLSDLHGEYEPFLHILKNASGVIKTKIDETFGNSMTSAERRKLATLIYYPEEKLAIIKEELKRKEERKEFYKITLYRLIKICTIVASKYSRSKVRKAMPKGYEYIIDELLHANQNVMDKESYYDQIIHSIIKLERAEAFIIAISNLIQQLAIDHLHIIGDIYDRGPGPDIIMDKLMKYHSIDIEWGNHDIIWMGSACGSAACIMNVLRICARYGNLDILEDAYGINIRPMIEFAEEEYPKVSSVFQTNKIEGARQSEIEKYAKIEKAAAIIQFKLEGNIIKKHPEYEMEDRLLLDKIQGGKIRINNIKYKLLDDDFPTIDEKDPYCLTEREEEVVQKLVKGFKNSEKLQRHVNFLYTKGSIYKIYNGNLLIHGCIPMDENGELAKVNFDGNIRSGKELLDYIDQIARKAFFAEEQTEEKQNAMDFMWYLWCGKYSPIFCKDAMRTFERYFIDDKEIRKEIKNPFYTFTQEEGACIKIIKEFNLDPETSHIISGHIPVKYKEGESPIKANGKLLVIDGGLSKAYQKTTGIAGYTLIYNSYGLVLTAHEAFTSTEQAILNELDIHSTKQIVEKVERKKISDTDIGRQLKEEIEDLNQLLNAYRNGMIK